MILICDVVFPASFSNLFSYLYIEPFAALGFTVLLKYSQEVDLVCSSFTGASGSDVLDVAAYTRSDVYGMLTRYPEPYSSIYGHITTFSLNVWRCCVKCIQFICILFAFI